MALIGEGSTGAIDGSASYAEIATVGLHPNRQQPHRSRGQQIQVKWAVPGG